MAYILSGSEGSFSITSGDGFYTGFLAACSINAWSMVINSESHDVTPLGGAGANGPAATTLSGLRSYAASLSGFVYAIPRVGNQGLVAIANPAYYTTNARAWSLTLRPYTVHDITKYIGTVGNGPTWREFRPDPLLTWSGSYTAGVDSSTVINTAGSGTEPIQSPSLTALDTGAGGLQDITLTYGDSGTDEAFSGAAQITGASVPVVRGGKTESTFSFIGSGPLGAVGTNNLFTSSGISSGKVVAPIWGQNGSATPLVAKFSTLIGSRYFQTVDMFWTRITISCEVGSPVTFSMDLLGSGALTSN